VPPVLQFLSFFCNHSCCTHGQDEGTLELVCKPKQLLKQLALQGKKKERMCGGNIDPQC
jgi:hypothetical protein